MATVSLFDEVGLVFAFLASVAFLVGYSVIARWWRDPVGRALAAMDGGLALALMPTAIHYMVGINLQHAFFSWYRGASLILVGAITLWRLRAVWRVQRQSTPRHRHAASPQAADDPPPQPTGDRL